MESKRLSLRQHLAQVSERLQNHKIAVAFVLIILTLILVSSSNYLSYAKYQKERNQTLSLITRHRLSDHIEGNASGLRLILYSDLECPYCKSFHNTIVELF